jgi:hypothetical protein
MYGQMDTNTMANGLEARGTVLAGLFGQMGWCCMDDMRKGITEVKVFGGVRIGKRLNQWWMVYLKSLLVWLLLNLWH